MMPCGPSRSHRPDERRCGVPAAGTAYRYNPADCLMPANSPKLRLTTNGRNQTASLLCHEAQLESFYWPDGRATHCGTFQLESFGATEFNPPLSPAMNLKGAMVNGQSVGLASPETGRELPAIHLPPQLRFVTVTLYFDSREQALASGGVIDCPLKPNAGPILSGNWKVWLPTNYGVSSESKSANPGFDWRGRLFGPLSRRAAPL